MKTELLMDFSIDRENNRAIVKREFAAPVEEVWNAWTKKELLDQWWAPKPWKARTKEMDFREGGHWLYAMVGPDGEEQNCRVDYTSVSHLKSFSGTDAFSDKDWKVNNQYPVSTWNVKFDGAAGNTIVTIEIKWNNQEDMDKYIEMGFKEGFTAALENLDELLK